MNKIVSGIIEVCIILLTFLISIGGFMRLAEELFTKDLIGLITLFTLPAIMGALLANAKNYKMESKLFLIATSLLFIGLFSMKIQIMLIDSFGSIIVFLGGLIFIYSLLKTTFISIITND